MAIIIDTNQYKYSKRGPLDAKALVKTYADLLNRDTWLVDGTMTAYNGMITAVWLNKEDLSKNGIYFLFDSAVTSSLQVPDIATEANWHKLMELSDISDLSTRLSAIESELPGIKDRITTLEENQLVLRRDNEYNFKNITPKANEICIVDVAGYGIRVKIGDGLTAFVDLPYTDDYTLKSIDSIITKGYFYQGSFYADIEHEVPLENITGRIYIDTISSKLYTYNGANYETQKVNLPNATAEIAGVMKLYDTAGNNTDGTMTQRAITDELDDKFEMAVDKDAETLIFDKDLF